MSDRQNREGRTPLQAAAAQRALESARKRRRALQQAIADDEWGSEPPAAKADQQPLATPIEPAQPSKPKTPTARVTFWHRLMHTSISGKYVDD